MTTHRTIRVARPDNRFQREILIDPAGGIMTTRRFFTAASLSAAPLLFLRGRSASAQVSEVLQTPRSEAEQITIDAYVYGYSLVTTQGTRVQMSNVDKLEGMHAPAGQFANIKRYPPANF